MWWERGRRGWAPLVAALPVAALLAGCGSEEPKAAQPEAAPAEVPTLTAVPLPPDPPPSGKLIAEIRQSTIDQSRGQMQVWIDNDTRRRSNPTSIRYVDPRFPAPVSALDVRPNPAQSERGYPVVFPREPRCTTRSEARGTAAGRLEVVSKAGVEKVRVSDPVGVVDRYLEARCAESALADVADVRWSDEVAADSKGKGAIGRLRLLVTPRALAGRRLMIERISGTHLFNAADGADGWTLDRRISGTAAQRIDLEMRPARCDGHAFSEGGNATAFFVTFVLDGKRSQVVVRMSEAGMADAFAYGATSCGIEL